ncbi:multidrug resistance efflux pump, RND family, membrane fusion protein [Syntrophotalea carbinolica DSM 2380]|uniref:Multidrug resistance efflux pump, RND family, membrane fusion protein n=1 Tax=Syntrophotalea carbinolica (strain DSM 2380 / NBRC 103641 / GraBd1) TaxID=338963 RepID=Q3A0G3_SYNC1|nr:HlyD family secretion protein [Syntrophotalea carbinolica]ABA90144.1 multidrug resistance efflux pump, RND family, membrane fusion protein [Syntrophotalea carbinolica DSM 2380]
MQTHKLKTISSIAVTLIIFSAAILTSIALWQRYMNSPWTRDGRVRADIIKVAADVSGIVASMAVHDNQLVHKGDLLFTIDQERYRLALAQTRARLAASKATMVMRSREFERRAQLGGKVISNENRENSRAQADAAEALYEEAQAACAVAELNLQRTEVRAPVDGYITNLAIHPGDYVTAGTPKLAVVDKNSFWIYGYFEENKLRLLQREDPVEIRLMSSETPLHGHIESLARGITDRDNPTGSELLANVNPVFNWVRLAQRVPVRVRIDEVPEEVPLAAGMTCTVIVKPTLGSKRIQKL